MSAPADPIDVPIMRKIRKIEPRVAPIVRRIAISRVLSFTSMVRPEIILNAASDYDQCQYYKEDILLDLQ